MAASYLRGGPTESSGSMICLGLRLSLNGALAPHPAALNSPTAGPRDPSRTRNVPACCRSAPSPRQQPLEETAMALQWINASMGVTFVVVLAFVGQILVRER